ncbi:hypothetical protein A3731_07265 [Roseovarius sp. HI0049]|nr:hypothetical protein A3731_07265 [Roseovarius sp. HI0049]
MKHQITINLFGQVGPRLDGVSVRMPARKVERLPALGAMDALEGAGAPALPIGTALEGPSGYEAEIEDRLDAGPAGSEDVNALMEMSG